MLFRIIKKETNNDNINNKTKSFTDLSKTNEKIIIKIKNTVALSFKY